MYCSKLPEDMITVEDEQLGTISFEHTQDYDLDQITEDQQSRCINFLNILMKQ